MEGAEVQPSEETWLAMESALISAENRRLKRKVVVYRRLAAASVIFGLLLGALGFYSWRNTSPGSEGPAALSQLSQTENDVPDKEPGHQKDEKPVVRNAGKTKGPSSVRNRAQQYLIDAEGNSKYRTLNEMSPLLLTDSRTNESSSSQPVGPTLSRAGEEGNNQASKQGITARAEESPLKIQNKKEEPPNSDRDQLPGVLATTQENEKKENKNKLFKENLWASLSVAAGNYNSGALAQGNTPVAAAPSPVYAQSSMSFGGPTVSRSAVGSSRSIGLAFGKRITRRWVILSGINYLNQTLGYTSNTSSQGQAYLANYSSLKQASSVTFTSPYQINSVLEFVSVPVQAGYLIADHKLGLQMNAGISTDFLLRNTLEDPSGQVSSFSLSAGSTDSPYRSVNWAGLISTELSYRLAPQYRVSIIPGIRYLFHSAFKSGSTDHPYVTDIGFRFRYILR